MKQAHLANARAVATVLYLVCRVAAAGVKSVDTRRLTPADFDAVASVSELVFAADPAVKDLVSPDAEYRAVLQELHRSGWLGEQAAKLASCCDAVWEAALGKT